MLAAGVPVADSEAGGSEVCDMVGGLIIFFTVFSAEASLIHGVDATAMMASIVTLVFMTESFREVGFTGQSTNAAGGAEDSHCESREIDTEDNGLLSYWPWR